MTVHGRSDTARWRRARALVRHEQKVCAWCGGDLDWILPPRTAESVEIDHVVPLSQGGDPYARWNLRAVHRKCHHKINPVPPPNKRGRDGRFRPRPKFTSRWLDEDAQTLRTSREW